MCPPGRTSVQSSGTAVRIVGVVQHAVADDQVEERVPEHRPEQVHLHEVHRVQRVRVRNRCAS